MPVGYDNPRNLIAIAGVAAAIYAFLNWNLFAAVVAALILGYFAFMEK
jgi:hypothetical protein